MTIIDRRPPRVPAAEPAQGNASWGIRSQVGGTVKDLQDLLGNNDGIWGNERQKAGTTGDFFDKNPLALRLRAAASTGLSAKDEVQILADFVSSREADWGRPVVDPDVKSALNGGDLFAAQKAIALTRMGRTPAEVTERFVKASGEVDGKQIDEARVFTQHFEPKGKAIPEVFVMSPGFLESGRAFLDEVARANESGIHVVVMDHQWAGHTQGKKGGIHSGESIALHTAAVVADAYKVGRELYGEDVRVTVVGESMGGGPGAFGAAMMAKAGKLRVDGVQKKDDPWQKPIDLLLQAPFFGATPGLVNGAISLAAKLPLLNQLAAPGVGVPDFVDHPVGEHKVAQAMVLEDIRGRTQAFGASDAFVKKLDALLADGVRPDGFVTVVQAKDDPLASFDETKKRVDQLQALGPNTRLVALDGVDHGLSASHPHIIDMAIERAVARANARAA